MSNEKLQIPPMPKLYDFRDGDGQVSLIAYNIALKAWERVAERVAQAAESATFRESGQ